MTRSKIEKKDTHTHTSYKPKVSNGFHVLSFGAPKPTPLWPIIQLIQAQHQRPPAAAGHPPRWSYDGPFSLGRSCFSRAEAMRMTAGDPDIAKMRGTINGAYYLMFHRLPNLRVATWLFFEFRVKMLRQCENWWIFIGKMPLNSCWKTNSSPV